MEPAPDPKVVQKTSMALVLIDVINRLDFEGGKNLINFAIPMAQKIARLKKRMRSLGIPAIYVNDNFGHWNSDFRSVLRNCLASDAPGRVVAQILKPQSDDYFILKPRHSGFFGTPLSLLLDYLHAKTLVLTGMAGNNCVHFTAYDAYLRKFGLIVPSDCIASESARRNAEAIRQMRVVLKADVRRSAEIVFPEENLKSSAKRGHSLADRPKP
jgi:nicotinamidase-related amidase